MACVNPSAACPTYDECMTEPAPTPRDTHDSDTMRTTPVTQPTRVEHATCATRAAHATHTAHANHLEHVEHGFGPVWDAESRVLMLGSMPSPKSRQASFYYMHPRNRFWPVMAAVCAHADARADADGDDAPGATAESRRAYALRHGFALWDVIASCDISGASDASIRNAVPNDLVPLLEGSCIAAIATTGAKAAQLYRRLCLPRIVDAGFDLPHLALPSTSPANAAMRLDTLIDIYRDALLPYLGKTKTPLR